MGHTLQAYLLNMTVRCRQNTCKMATSLLQVLKTIRYSTKLLLATAYKDSDTELTGRLREFESSIGTSRCACRAPLCLVLSSNKVNSQLKGTN